MLKISFSFDSFYIPMLFIVTISLFGIITHYSNAQLSRNMTVCINGNPLTYRYLVRRIVDHHQDLHQARHLQVNHIVRHYQDLQIDCHGHHLRLIQSFPGPPSKVSKPVLPDRKSFPSEPFNKSLPCCP